MPVNLEERWRNLCCYNGLKPNCKRCVKAFLKEQQAEHNKDMGIQIKLAYGEGILEGEERGNKNTIRSP